MFDLKENLEQIKKLSGELKSLPQIAHIKEGEVTYDMVSGTSEGHAIYKAEKIAVQYNEMSAESEMSAHFHYGMKEILICYDGDLEVITNEINDAIIASAVHASGVIVIEPYVPHIAKSINGCKIIAITVPASKGYPATKDNSDGK